MKIKAAGFKSSELDLLQKEEILEQSGLGCWRIVTRFVAGVVTGKMMEEHEMFLDDTMLSLLGQEEHTTPSECYEYWFDRLTRFFSHLTDQFQPVRYRWAHPLYGEVTILCQARRSTPFGTGVRGSVIEGTARLSYQDADTATLLLSPIAHKIFQTFPLGMDLWDRNMRLVDSNVAAYRRFFLKNKEEYLERFFDNIEEFQPTGEHSVKKFFDGVRMAFDEGQYTFQWTHRGLHDEFVTATITAVKLYNDYVLCVWHDLSQDHMVQKKWHEYVDKESILFNTVPLGVIQWDEERAVDCNTEMRSLLGINDKRQFLHSPYEFFPYHQKCGRRSSELLKQYHEKALAEGYCKFEMQFSRKNEEIFLAEVIIFNADVGKKKVNYYFVKDLQNEVNLRKELDSYAKCLQLALDQCPLGVGLWDTPDEALYFNHHMLTMLGIMSKQEFHDAGDLFVFCPEVQPCGTASYEKAFACADKALADGYYTFEWMHMSVEGNLVPTLVTLIRTKFEGKDVLLSYVKDLRVDA